MKLKFISFNLIVFCFFIQFSQHSFSQTSSAEKYTIVIHGGVGTISKDMPDSIKNEYLKSLSLALNIGKNILESGGTSLDAVEQTVRFLEDDPKFNAGRGAVYTSEGTFELDASIMDGRDLSCGAVAGVKTVKHPISLARLVKEKTTHVLLAGEGADKFGSEMKVEIVPNQYFSTPQRLKQWNDLIKNQSKGTVGCVALDKYGNLAAATSTGGIVNKMAGRVGDSPIIGAGTYADNQSCAVSCSGKGELFIMNCAAYDVSALMKYKGYTLKIAAEEVINKKITNGDGGLIAVDKDGNYTMVFNTNGMFRGAANSSGIFEVKIWE